MSAITPDEPIQSSSWKRSDLGSSEVIRLDVADLRTLPSPDVPPLPPSECPDVIHFELLNPLVAGSGVPMAFVLDPCFKYGALKQPQHSSHGTVWLAHMLLEEDRLIYWEMQEGGSVQEIALKMTWPAYPGVEVTRTLPLWAEGGYPLTYGEFAKSVVETFEDFIVDCRTRTADPAFTEWAFGDGPIDLTLNKLWLVALHRVGGSCYQAEIKASNTAVEISCGFLGPPPDDWYSTLLQEYE